MTLKHTKIIAILVGFTGVVCYLGDQFGWFINPERIEMLRMMRTEAYIPATMPGFEELYKAFPPPVGTDISEVQGMNSLPSTMSANHVIAFGPLRYDRAPEDTVQVATISELEDWAHDTPYTWIAFVLLFVSWFLSTIESFRQMANKSINPSDDDTCS